MPSIARPASLRGLRVAWTPDLGDLPVEPAVTAVLSGFRAGLVEESSFRFLEGPLEDVRLGGAAVNLYAMADDSVTSNRCRRRQCGVRGLRRQREEEKRYGQEHGDLISG